MGKSKTYEEFVEKFKPKKTTDDCMTPPEIYEVVKDWACGRYQIDPSVIERPFWPGGDYENYDYPVECVVIDNPPFSILSKICRFYLDRGRPAERRKNDFRRRAVVKRTSGGRTSAHNRVGVIRTRKRDYKGDELNG